MLTRKKKIIIACVLVVALLAGAYVVINLIENKLQFATGSMDVANTRMDAAMDVGSFGRTLQKSGMSFGLAQEAMNSPIMTPTEEKIDRMVIKTGYISMVVNDISETLRFIQDYVLEKNGYVVSSKLSDPQENPSGQITVKLPSQTFDESINVFNKLAIKITSSSTQGQDVTEEYTDYDSELRNLQKSEEQLLKIMERSGTINDVLNVQRELNTVRGQIERIQGKMKYLRQSAEMSTITINLATEESALPLVTPTNKWEPLVVIKRASRSLIELFKDISYFVIWLAIYAIIWIPVFLIIYWIYRRWKRKLSNS